MDRRASGKMAGISLASVSGSLPHLAGAAEKLGGQG